MRRHGASAAAVIILGLCLVWRLLPAGGPPAARAEAEPPVLWDVAGFSFVDQDERTFTSAHLRGRVWVSDFFLTHCAGVCPRMTDALLTLQKRLDPSVHFVSFSVDPLRDTPAVLKAYARKVGADESRWRFLTTEQAQLRQTAAAMGLITSSEANDPDLMLHSDKFFLIDRGGRVRGIYESSDPAQCDRLVEDAQRLVASGAAVSPPLTVAPGRVYEVVAGTPTTAPSAEALARDLVCGMTVQACAKTPSAARDGRSYYFCNEHCRNRFEQNPERYLVRQ
jgi:protein SCO1/2